jgi:hypothetical protein
MTLMMMSQIETYILCAGHVAMMAPKASISMSRNRSSFGLPYRTMLSRFGVRIAGERGPNPAPPSPEHSQRPDFPGRHRAGFDCAQPEQTDCLTTILESAAQHAMSALRASGAHSRIGWGPLRSAPRPHQRCGGESPCFVLFCA